MRARSGVYGSVYCDESTWPAVETAFHDARMRMPPVWGAAAPGDGDVLMHDWVAHQYGTVGACDVSVVADVWPGVDTRPPAPHRKKGTDMRLVEARDQSRWYRIYDTGKVIAVNQQLTPERVMLLAASGVPTWAGANALDVVAEVEAALVAQGRPTTPDEIKAAIVG